MKKVVISGATSMLGMALVRTCMQNRTAVCAIVRKDSPKNVFLPESPLLTVIRAGLEEYGTLDAAPGQYDAFYHFAWEGTSCESRRDVSLQLRNVETTLSAVRLAKRMGCAAFVGAGSQAELGRAGAGAAGETEPAPETAYGIGKYAAGRLSGILCGQLGMRFIWTRVFSVYGEFDQPSTMITYCIRSLLQGEKPSLTKCEQRWDYLYCGDAAEAFYALGEKGKDRTSYNIGSGVARPLSEFVEIIRDAIDKNAAVGFGEHAYAPGQVMRLCADISRLRDDTGFNPGTSFEAGIEKTIAWNRAAMEGTHQ